MESNTLYPVTFLLSAFILISSAEVFNISESLNSFAISLLKETSEIAGASVNVALSPYPVYALMALISEGAQHNTLRELDTTLMLPENKKILRNSYQNLTDMLSTKSNAVELDYSMALFHNQDFPLKDSFQAVSKNVYDVMVKPVDFKNPQNAQTLINKYVADATRQRITNFVSQDDVKGAHVFLTSVMFFKGQWGSPFKENNTRKEPFFSEANQMLGEIDMMFQVGVFPYARIEEIGAHALELPYGHDGKMSMVLILPFRGKTISGVLTNLSKQLISFVLDILESSAKEYTEDEIHVYVPKFKINSDFNLNVVLNKMGIKDVFDLSKADLLGMFDQYLYLSRFIQRAEIDVDEKGTVASAAAGAGFIDKMAPIKIKFNRPFMYFIIDKPTKSVVFEGKLSSTAQNNKISNAPVLVKF